MRAFEAMRTGQTQLVSIVAEAGTGKSRLLAEFLRKLREQGALADVAIREAACSSLGGRARATQSSASTASRRPPTAASRRLDSRGVMLRSTSRFVNRTA